MDKRPEEINMINKNVILKEKFGNKISINENLSKYSWFNLGGPGEIFFRPDTDKELSNFFKNHNHGDNEITIIGAGSNTLIRDGGVKGIVIKLSSKFSYINLLDNNIIETGAATSDKKISNFATDNSLTGLEFLACIPGSIGGAIKMNTGCYGYEISNILESIKVINFKGEVSEIKRKNINFYYRGCSLPDNIIILSAKLIGKKSTINSIKKKQLELIKKKKIAQPSQVKTCGSTFKNQKNRKAWELIKEAKCDQFSVGQAKISKKHCNFFINEGKAKSAEIEQLIESVKQKVFETTGISLELEIKIIGNK